MRQVEQAEPPAAAAAEPAPAGAIEPPPLPPGTPDAQQFLEAADGDGGERLVGSLSAGRDMPVAQDEWRATADTLGGHVRPIIEFLREHEERKASCTHDLTFVQPSGNLVEDVDGWEAGPGRTVRPDLMVLPHNSHDREPSQGILPLVTEH